MIGEETLDEGHNNGFAIRIDNENSLDVPTLEQTLLENNYTDSQKKMEKYERLNISNSARSEIEQESNSAQFVPRKRKVTQLQPIENTSSLKSLVEKEPYQSTRRAESLERIEKFERDRSERMKR